MARKHAHHLNYHRNANQNYNEIPPHTGQTCLKLSGIWLFCQPMDYSPPGSSAHGIFQARLLEWVAISLCRVSFQSRDWACVSRIGRWVLYHWAARKAPWSEQPPLKSLQITNVERVWRKGNPPALLEGMQIGAAAMENSVEGPQKTKTPVTIIQESYSRAYIQTKL